MDNCRLLELLGQAEASATGEVFREFLRGGVRLMLADVMAAEVSGLCGAKYHPADEVAFQRAGSAPGRVLWEGRSEAVQRPRVRRRNDDGSTQEVLLETYQAAKQPDQLHSAILRALVAGVSGREMQAVHPESSGLSKSNVSRLWSEAGVKLVEELLTREIASALKQAVRRVYPEFNEGYYGYTNFSQLLQDIAAKDLIELEYDANRGNYKVRRKQA